MAIKIEKKIAAYSLVGAEEAEEKPNNAASSTEKINEDFPRPQELRGSTYKIKPPVLESALYITINDVVINKGTKEEECHPFEIFVNSKNMEHFQWIVALTRVISAVFRKGGDASFLIEELGSVFDPSGGYYKKGGRYMPSLVAEIGDVLKTHLENIGKIEKEGIDENKKAMIEAKKEEIKASGTQLNEDGYPANASVCTKCNTKANVIMDGCTTCLACGESKCG